MRLVLRENADPQVPRVDEIEKHEVDQSVGAAEGNRGFGRVRGQGITPLTLPPVRDNALATTAVPGMRVAMMTREYPPEVYGGAGVHVTELVAQLRKLCEVDVHCMGAPRQGAIVGQPDS